MTKQEEIKKYQERLGIISEVARFIMRFADYSSPDAFHIPLDIWKSLINGIIPYNDDEFLKETEEQKDD